MESQSLAEVMDNLVEVFQVEVNVVEIQTDVVEAVTGAVDLAETVEEIQTDVVETVTEAVDLVETVEEIQTDVLETVTEAVDLVATETVAMTDVTLDEVDQLFRLALTTSWCKCGDDHAHGQADIRVDSLLENSAALARAFARNNKTKPDAVQPLVETSADVTGRKRRITPKGGVDDWRLNEA